MRFLQHHHAQSALANTATNAQWQLVVQQLLVEIELLSILLTLNLQLSQQALLVHTNTHRAKLKGATKHRIPNQDIAIQSTLAILGNRVPIIIVGSSAVVLLAIRQLSANTLQEHGTILLADSILALLRTKVGIHLQQILSMNKMDASRQERLQHRECLARQILRAANGSINALHHILQESYRAILLVDNSLPVPLVHI